VKRDLDSTGKYQRFLGTSAATPYVAGVVALMLQKKPSLSVGDIKELLGTHATKAPDKLLPKEAGNGWGNGKLDADAVIRMFKAIN
jgi:bacillopeptidase F